ncbi:unnamed protein product [Arctogadus glacialis]
MSVPPAVASSAQKADSHGEMQSAAVTPSYLPSQAGGKIPGRKRGRPPLRSVAPKMDFPGRYPESPTEDERCKKEGKKKPGASSRKSPNYLLYTLLPSRRPAVVTLKRAVAGCIDALPAEGRVTLITRATGGRNRAKATFDGKQHLLSLPVVNSIGYVLRFLKKLCRSLHCENLFSDQPIAPHSGGAYHSDETSMTDEYHMDQSEAKRYSVDPGDSAFNSISSSYSPKSSYGFRGPSQQFSGGARQPASSPSSFQENNRTAYGGPQEPQDTKGPPQKDPSSWSVEDVVWFIREADPHSLGPHADLFRKHEIDGNALLLLKSDMIMKYLGLKLGPALKLCYHIDKLKQTKL